MGQDDIFVYGALWPISAASLMRPFSSAGFLFLSGLAFVLLFVIFRCLAKTKGGLDRPLGCSLGGTNEIAELRDRVASECSENDDLAYPPITVRLVWYCVVLWFCAVMSLG